MSVYVTLSFECRSPAIELNRMDALRLKLQSIQIYNVLPLSSKVVVFDGTLPVKKALSTLLQHGLQAAPVYDSARQEFAGMLTVTDYIRLILYYYNSGSTDEIDDLQIFGLKYLTSPHKQRFLKTLNLTNPNLSQANTYRSNRYSDAKHNSITSLDPNASISTAAFTLLNNKLHRLPLITSDNSLVFVLTQFKILRYITSTCPEVFSISLCPIVLGVGSYSNIATASPDTPLLTLLTMFTERRLSSIPILDGESRVIDVCEKYDILNLSRENAFYDLDMRISEALARRSSTFEGIHSCRINDTLGGILATIGREVVHRFVVVDSDNKLKGVISLSDILSYLVGR